MEKIEVIIQKCKNVDQVEDKPKIESNFPIE